MTETTFERGDTVVWTDDEKGRRFIVTGADPQASWSLSLLGIKGLFPAGRFKKVEPTFTLGQEIFGSMYAALPVGAKVQKSMAHVMREKIGENRWKGTWNGVAHLSDADMAKETRILAAWPEMPTDPKATIDARTLRLTEGGPIVAEVEPDEKPELKPGDWVLVWANLGAPNEPRDAWGIYLRDEKDEGVTYARVPVEAIVRPLAVDREVPPWIGDTPGETLYLEKGAEDAKPWADLLDQDRQAWEIAAKILAERGAR